MHSNKPAITNEWMIYIKPHMNKEPEGLWNLLGIVKEMMKSRDLNASRLLPVITERCVAYTQVRVV